MTVFYLFLYLVAVWELESPVENFKNTVILASKKDERPGTAVKVAGWGITELGQTQAELMLKEVNLQLYNQKQCKRIMNLESEKFNAKDHLCAGILAGGKGILLIFISRCMSRRFWRSFIL